jgi:glucoamylase
MKSLLLLTGLLASQIFQNSKQQQSSWADAQKLWVTTAYEEYDTDFRFSDKSKTAPISKVWLTVGQGVLNEIYFPTVDEAQVRDSQILVTDGNTFFSEERNDARSRVEWLSDHPLDVQFVNEDKKGRYTITRQLVPDPDANVVWMYLNFRSNDPKLKYFLHHNTSLGNTGADDTCFVQDGRMRFADDVKKRTQVLYASVGFGAKTCGLDADASDGFQQLKDHFTLSNLQSTSTGNVVATAELLLTPHQTRGTWESEAWVALEFSTLTATPAAVEVLPSTYQRKRALYLSQWKKYLDRLIPLRESADHDTRLAAISAAVLKTHEDKTFPGAMVASLSVPGIPNGNNLFLNDNGNQRGAGGYHLVWPRDMSHVASAFLAAGDRDTPVAILNRFRSLQLRTGEWPYPRHYDKPFRKLGSYMQNTWVDGTPYWSQLQIDQTALPIILGFTLWEEGLVRLDDTRFLLDSADFISDFGPWTAQDRWEENHGYSPASIATAMAALASAAEMAEELGDKTRAELYRETAKRWAFNPKDNIDAWLFTETGALANGKYFVRVEGSRRQPSGELDVNAPINPNDDEKLVIGNLPWGSAFFPEKSIIDGGFIHLVRFGVKGFNDPHILDSITAYDQTISVTTPKGVGYYRYNHDGYGAEHKGRLWPILTGERGHYEIAAGRPATAYIKAMENFSNAGGMIPEQVWDEGPASGTGTPGTATPLAWSHAEYLLLLRSARDRAVFDLNGASQRLLLKKDARESEAPRARTMKH